MGRGILGMVLAVGLLVFGFGVSDIAAGQATVAAGEPLVIHFDNGKNTLTAGDRAAIQRLLDANRLRPENKILVVGYSDGRGDAKKNARLSQQRAETVRKEIIRASGAAARNVLAVGRGAENPVGDNQHNQGRARNRRVEIYWTQAMDLKGKAIGQRTGSSAAVVAMVEDARALIRRRRLAEAVRILDQARVQGGEGESSWQAVYGIAGFYAGMDAQTVKSHLLMALSLDAFNQEARDYLGRVKAREKVADGTVTARMGRSEQDPIPVTCDAQAHEYLHLFDVQPLSKQRSIIRPVEAWHCRDGQGRRMIYYFDRSQVYRWAFARNEADDFGQGNFGQTSPTSASVQKSPSAGEVYTKKEDSLSSPAGIWESQLFR